MIDANANRAAEALRTLEDHARFLLSDAAVTEELKSLRHALAVAISTIPRTQRLAARNTGGDVGTSIRTATEMRRAGPTQIVAAAAGRATEAIRVLEESFKTIDPAVAATIEQLRYRTYTAAANVELEIAATDAVNKLESATVYALVGDQDPAKGQRDPIEYAKRLIEAGVDVLQLRIKRASDRRLLRLAERFVAICREAGRLSIINDRADVAAAVDADGVHVGQDELTVAACRRCLGTGRLVGVSTHNVAQAKAAIDDGADYLGCGPVFPSGTKSFDEFAGLAYLRQVSNLEAVPPAFAIGGIDATNIDQIAAAGFRRVAISGALQLDPEAVVKRLRQAISPKQTSSPS